MRPKRLTTGSPLAESSPADQRTEGSSSANGSVATPDCQMTVVKTELKQNKAAVYAIVTMKDQHGREYEITGARFYWDLKQKPLNGQAH